MAIGNLYITTKDYLWSDNNVLLLDSGNLSEVIDNTAIVDVHSSVEDLGYQGIDVACQAAQTITLIDVTTSSPDFSDSNFNSYGRLFYELYRNKHKVTNFELVDDIDLDQVVATQPRPSTDSTLWIVGAGITNGCDVHANCRWGDILAEKLDMPSVHLTHGHASVYWAADQILRSDISTADIVIWEIPEPARVEISSGWAVQPISQHLYSTVITEQRYWDTAYFGSQAILNKSLREIAQVVNFCDKIGAKLYLINLSDMAWLPFMLRNKTVFNDCVKDLQIERSVVTYIDMSADKLKPGPAHHAVFAEQIFEFINR